MKKTIALFVLLFPLLSIAQNTFQRGYFIQNGTKTECLIKNLAWKNNPVSIEYKLNEADAPKTKTIKEISEFSVDDAYKYIRFTVNIDRSPIALDKLTNIKDPQWSKETLFLNVLVDGKTNLYQYEDGNLIKYFFSTGDHTQAEQLVFKEYIKETAVAQNNMFRQQLYSLMKGDSNDMEKFKKLKYSKDTLLKLFLEYNGTNGQKVTDHTEKQNKGSINLKITPGVSFNSLSLDINSSDNRFDFGGDTTYRIGAELEYVLPFNNNKWSIFLDPNYQTYAVSGQNGNQKFKADYKYIELPIGVRHFMFLNQNSKFFVDGTYSLGFALGDSNIEYGYRNLAIEKNSTIAFGAGFSYKQYSIEARYSVTRNILDYVNLAANYKSTNIILGYKLF